MAAMPHCRSYRHATFSLTLQHRTLRPSLRTAAREELHVDLLLLLGQHNPPLENVGARTSAFCPSWLRLVELLPSPSSLTLLLTDELLRGATQTARCTEIWIGVGNWADGRTAAHARHCQRVTIDLTCEGCCIQGWRREGHRGCSLVGLSENLSSERCATHCGHSTC